MPQLIQNAGEIGALLIVLLAIVLGVTLYKVLQLLAESVSTSGLLVEDGGLKIREAEKMKSDWLANKSVKAPGRLQAILRLVETFCGGSTDQDGCLGLLRRITCFGSAGRASQVRITDHNLRLVFEPYLLRGLLILSAIAAVRGKTPTRVKFFDNLDLITIASRDLGRES